MASSSDWIAAAQGEPRPESAGWLQQVRESDGFVERFPLGVGAPLAAHLEPTAEPDAIAEAFAEGQAAGRAEAEAEATQTSETSRKLRLAFRTLDQAALDSLASELSDTVLSLCEQVMAAHAIDRAALAERCVGAARRIGNAAGDLMLHLNPEDLTMLGAEFAQQWTVQPDPALERGNIRLEGEDGAVRDGPREWRRAIAAALSP